MNPIGDSLRKRMRMFPSLTNCCTIDWIEGIVKNYIFYILILICQEWPDEALVQVAEMFLEKKVDLKRNSAIEEKLIK